MEEIIKRLEQLINQIYAVAKSFIDGGLNDKQLAVDHFGRIISCLMTSKTIHYSINIALSGIPAAEKFIEDGLPAKFPKNIKTAQRYLKETHTGVRFLLFQNYFSQVEFTFRIIKRNDMDESNQHPFNYVSENYHILDSDFVGFIKRLRNTIHNNGFYFPDTKDKELFKYTLNGKEFTFVYGKAIKDITIVDIFYIIDRLNSECEKLFKENKRVGEIIIPIK